MRQLGRRARLGQGAAVRRLRGPSHRAMLYLFGRPVVSGPACRVSVGARVGLANVAINTLGGTVTIGDHVFFGHDVMLLTGTHDFRVVGQARQAAQVTSGRDIRIESGAWIASRAIIIGPCTIGANAVIGCGAIIDFDVPANTIVRVRQDLVRESIRYAPR